jgi:hypothetical protein
LWILSLFLGSFINSHEIKIGLPTFAPFFHHFFKTKYFFQKLKALERDKVVFHFYFFLQMCGWLHCATIFLHTKKRVVQKASYIFFMLLSLFLGFKNEISFHIFHIAFFSFINISSCKMICNSFFSLVKLWCNRVDFFYTIIVGKSKKDSVLNSKQGLTKTLLHF